MEDSAPKQKKPEEGSILAKVVVPEGTAIIIAKAESVVEKAKLNEALRIIDELEGEVTNMVVPPRFSREKIVSDSPYMMPGLVQNLKGLTEDEYKRQQLLRDLASIKNKIISNIEALRSVVSDIEATKQ